MPKALAVDLFKDYLKTDNHNQTYKIGKRNARHFYTTGDVL